MFRKPVCSVALTDDVVAVWKFDRFARSVSHLLRALDTFRVLGIEFVSLSESLETSNPAGCMVFTVLDFGLADGHDEMFKVWIEGGFVSERFGRLRCVVTHANLQPAVAAHLCWPGDSIWRALALDVLRIEDGLIAEIVVFPPDSFPTFGLPMMMDALEEQMSLNYSMRLCLISTEMPLSIGK
jgi:hypothetical protein